MRTSSIRRRVGAGAAFSATGHEASLGAPRRRLLRKVRFVAGRARGLAASSRRPFASRAVPTDDATVTQRIRSDAFRAAGVSTREVEVEVENGVATLCGSVDGPERADALVQRVAKVPGVRDVAAMIRVSDRRAA